MKPQAPLDIPSAPAVRACLAAAPLAAWLPLAASLPPRFCFFFLRTTASPCDAASSDAAPPPPPPPPLPPLPPLPLPLSIYLPVYQSASLCPPTGLLFADALVCVLAGRRGA